MCPHPFAMTQCPWRAGWIEDHNCLRYRLGDPSKFAFFRPQLLLSLHKVFDIGTYSILEDYFANFVAKRLHADKKPPVNSIIPATRASISPASSEVWSSFHFAIDGSRSSG